MPSEILISNYPSAAMYYKGELTETVWDLLNKVHEGFTDNTHTVQRNTAFLFFSDLQKEKFRSAAA
jgi:uncharacterized FlgJ-related protein